MSTDNEFTFPLERSQAMRVLGSLWTGSFSGQILVSALLFIGVLFIGNQDFNILSISFFIGFILPISFLLHRSVVSKGKKLMKPWCYVRFEGKTMHYKSGFPNTMIPDWQEIIIDKDNNNLIIKGSEVGGYHIRFSGKEIVRLGLWLNLDDARESANKLITFTKGKISENLSDEPKESHV